MISFIISYVFINTIKHFLLDDGKLSLTSQTSILASGVVDDSEKQNAEAECPAGTRKSHRSVFLTEKVKLLHQEKKENAASDVAEKERLALKAEKKKVERIQLGKQILTSFQLTQTSSVPPTSVFLVDDDDDDSQDYENIMLKLKKSILNSASSSSTMTATPLEVLKKMEDRMH